VEVGAADVGRCDPHDRIRWMLDPRVGDLLDPHLTLSAVDNSFHLRLR
jgi:hypothetical protein